MKHIVILYSGGLDSFIMHQYALKHYSDCKITCVFFDIGQEYLKKELKALPSFVEIRKIDWNASTASKDNVVGSIMIPGRNLTLCALAASIYLPDEIWIGAVLGETHKKATDKSWEFKDSLNNLLSYVYSPYLVIPKVRFILAEKGLSKLYSVKWALDNGVSVLDLLNTSSCLSGEEGNCGKCIVCARRWGIFLQLNIEEQYNSHPLQNKDILLMCLKMLDNEYYDDFRREEILPALSIYFKTSSNEQIRKNINDLLLN